MTADNLPIDIYFRPRNYTWDEMCDLPGANKDCIIDWDYEVRTIVKGRFRDACRNLWPLIEGLNFRSITIVLDLIGMEHGDIGYYPYDSSEEKGSYVFYASYDFLEAYLRNHFEESYELRYIWEHELIHLCDHRNITEFKYYNLSTDVREFLIHYLLSFRNEGLADLYFTMLGHNDIMGPETARQKFLAGIRKFEAVRWEDESIIKQKEYEFMSENGFYDLGPWMVLHVLSCPGYKGYTSQAASVAGHISSGEPVANEVMLEILSKSIRITNDDFAGYLSEPGLDGKPFIEKEILDQLAARIGKIRHKRTIPEDDEAYNRENSLLIGFFERHWGRDSVTGGKKKYDPAFRHVRLGPVEGRRFKHLGDIGEILAEQILRENGFTDIRNLNSIKKNFVFADYYAEKDRNKYLISVKARNKFENNGSLNTRYKLGRNLESRIESALKMEEFRDCMPAWLAIVLEAETYSAFFGLIKELDNNHGIPMSQKAKESYLCLAMDTPHEFDPDGFKNVYNKK
jgi:hypothetical protein